MWEGDNMNKIKSFENIFLFYPLPCWKKLGGEKNKKFAAGEKNKKFAAGEKNNLVQNIHTCT